jgi:hypothetical protein
MILGRPTNLVAATVTALLNLAVLVSGAAGYPIPAEIVAAGNVAALAIIGLVAGQPPTVNPGDTIHVTTPAGQPTYATTVAAPPAQDAPPVPVP